ncbi:MAG: HDOD domain-containing protein [Desulfopila sp.]
MARTLVITSGKGGVGKTNIGVNIAVELAARRYRTCLLDADLGLANVNLLFGIDSEMNLDDVLFHGTPPDQILVRTESGVDVFPGSSGTEKMANLDPGQLTNLVEGFGALSGYDFFLVDTSSGISRGVIAFCLAAPETLLVLTAEATSMADAYAVAKVLSLNNYRGRIRVLVNKCSSITQAKKTYLHFKGVADKHLHVNIAPGGAVLFDTVLEKALSQQRPAITLYPDSIFSQCIRALVSNLVRSTADAGALDHAEFWSRYTEFIQADLRLPGESGRARPGADRPRPAAESTPPQPAPRKIQARARVEVDDSPVRKVAENPAPPPGQPAPRKIHGGARTEADRPPLSEQAESHPPPLGHPALRNIQAREEVDPAQPTVDPGEGKTVGAAGQPIAAALVEEAGALAAAVQGKGEAEVVQPCGGILGDGRLLGPAPLYGYLLAAESHGRLTLAKICQVVKHDPALLGRLLEKYTLQRLPAERGQMSIEQIVRTLGVESVRQFIVNTATHGLLQPTTAEECLAVAEIWLHSLKCGLMSQALAGAIGYPYPEEAYIAGMLHDIGRLVLQARAPEIYGEASSPWHHTPKTLQAEREVAGVTHAELGARILADWEISSSIVDAARYHGESSERIATAFPMSRIVCLAHRLCSPVKDEAARAAGEAEERFTLSSAKVYSGMQAVNQEVNRLVSWYNMPCRQNGNGLGLAERLERYRQQATEFTTLQIVLAGQNALAGISETVRSICRGLHLLYGYGRAVCLLPDSRQLQLRAVGYPQCYGQEFIGHVSFLLGSKTSRVVDAYYGETLLVLAPDDLRSVADRQMLRFMGGKVLLCLPLSFGEKRVGLLVCGVAERDRRCVKKLEERLATFAARTAMQLARF